MNELDARIATLALAMDLAALRGCPEMVEHYAALYDEAVEEKITSDGGEPHGDYHG
jgi:hypothetical protein